jgi:hypothetical protein
VINWDTFGLFQILLDEFPQSLQEAGALQSENLEDGYSIKLSMIGFSHYRPVEDWQYEQYQAIRSRLDGDLVELGWFEDGAEAIRLFSCFCLGAMLGKLAAGEIDDVGFLLGDAHLAGFNVLNDEKICEQWHLVSETPK